MEEIVVVDFPAEGESCSVIARKTAEGWRYRWTYSSIWDDVDAELLEITPHAESSEASSIEEVLPEQWITMRPGCINPDWLAWFQKAVARAVTALSDEEDRRRAERQWQRVLVPPG